MNAESIVSALIEADDGRISGALVYFDGMIEQGLYVNPPDDGDIFTGIVDSLESIYPGIGPQGATRAEIDEVISNLMDQLNLVIVLNFENEVAVYARQVPPNLPPAFVKRIRFFFSVSDVTPVAVFYTPTSGNPHMSTAAHVFFGKSGKVEEPPVRPAVKRTPKGLTTGTTIPDAPKPADLATSPYDWDLVDVGDPEAAKQKFRRQFWSRGYQPRIGDVEKLGY